MDDLAIVTGDELSRVARNDKANFTGIFVVSFIVFLAIALCAQLLALPWRPLVAGRRRAEVARSAV